jgi:hypothetical protein
VAMKEHIQNTHPEWPVTIPKYLETFEL